ncbi:citrate lyase subunit alpha [Noviherbaspirillum galbum]|uniref:Citrate lyase alpha chain n=1 Tax=Noviherbaspirillum galbum TaxID=2709383 RepID=A0A6B3SN25_9BURK|nr:citrate lyase subunit alpha [Noviherbaspirillum galbum]NEX62163.1 citrate lyase subunit alpha [Noviherbaspirillum galbum]
MRSERIPAFLDGYGAIHSFRSAGLGRGKNQSRSKLMPGLRAAIEAAGLKDGGTISFHHHLRNGDSVVNMVLMEIAAMGIRGITVAASSIFPVHAPMVDHIREGVVGGLLTAYASGPVARAISRGELAAPVVLQTHGGRARAIASGELKIDVAFIAAPTADAFGNINGTDGPAACGTLGYAMVDAAHARRVVAITDNLVPFPASPIDIAQDQVDYVVEVEAIGNPAGIVSGTTRATSDPVGLAIAETAGKVIAASGLLEDGFSFQTGAGGISLAVAAQVRKLMHERAVRGSFASGGITGYIVDMLDEGLFGALLDVQCFDLKAVASYRRHPAHHCMSASMYANPHQRGAVVDQLDVMVLGAAEIDLAFNVNVTTGSDGVIIGGSGGHADAAKGARLALVTTRLHAAGIAKVVDRVTTVTTPGETIDVLVTEKGVAVNPRRPDLAERFLSHGIDVLPIERLRDLARAGASVAIAPPSAGSEGSVGRVVAVVEYRDGSVIDVVRQADHLA